MKPTHPNVHKTYEQQTSSMTSSESEAVPCRVGTAAAREISPRPGETQPGNLGVCSPGV